MLSLSRISWLGQRALSVYSLANGPREKASATAYIFRFLANRSSGPGRRRPSIPLTVRGVHFMLGPGELTPVVDVLQRRCYEQLPDFVPQHGWVVVDVGANIGAFSLLQASRGARVVAFEPNPECFGRLTAAVNANVFKDRLTVFNLAIGAESGSARLAVPGKGKGTLLGSIVYDWGTRPDVELFPVKVDSLDSALGAVGVDSVDLLKIDAEGAEPAILQGAGRILRSTRRLVLEYHTDVELATVGEMLGRSGFSEAHLLPGSPVGGVAYYRRHAILAERAQNHHASSPI